MTANRRQFSRIAFHAAADLVTGHGHHPVVVLDLSLKGGLVRLSENHRIGRNENCTLQVSLGTPGNGIRMKGTVAHVEGLYAGIACRNLDIDSATHLRRLVELNLGDPALLERELSALIAEE